MAPGAIIESVPQGHDATAITIPSYYPLSLNGVPARRAKSAKISGGVAAHAASSMFKKPTGKPKAKRWDHRLTKEALSRGGSTLKAAFKHLKDPNVISLGGGIPSSDYFPFESLGIKVPTIGRFSPREAEEHGEVLEARKDDYAQGKSLYDIGIAFNYGQATGSAQLLRFVTEHMEIVHDPAYDDWACSLTCGSTSSTDIVLRLLCERGSAMICEEYTFVATVEAARPMGVNVFGTKMDEQGIVAEALDEMLENWDGVARRAPKPHVLYTIPSGQNPTGATASLERRRAIYDVCRRHDLIIIEDEPYYFLQMDPYQSQDSTFDGAKLPSAYLSHDAFLKSLIPSYLRLDVDGRVMRLDSFSKVIAPGSRVGWITASEQLIDRYVAHQELCTQNPSGISQLALYKLLDEAWGHAGFLDWLQHIRAEYTRRRDVMMRACDEFLPREVTDWVPPMAGMFHWINIDWHKHPSVVRGGAKARADTRLMLEIEDEIFLDAVAEGALMAKGSWFRAEGDAGSHMFFRATFATASEENIREAIRRVGVALRRSFEL